MAKSKVAVVECDSYDLEKVYHAVKKSLNDISFKFKKGRKVLIKPNILDAKKPEEHVTTHPAIVDAICRILKENRCKITIGDSSGSGNTKEALETAGMADVARKYNANLLPFEKSKILNKEIKGMILKNAYFSKDVFDADLVVNVPKLKTHALTKFTCCVKNMFGAIPGAQKHRFHLTAPTEESFSNLLLDIYSQIKPQLNIVDAIVGIEGQGPAAGNPKPTRLIIAGEDAVATDIVCQRVMGLNPKYVYTTKYAIERGFFPGIDNVEVIGRIRVVKYKMPIPISKVPAIIKRLFHQSFLAKPVVNKKLCKKCGVCAKVCPPKCIDLSPYPTIERKKCINCFCCAEMCPYKAINLKSSVIIEVLGKIREVFR